MFAGSAVLTMAGLWFAAVRVVNGDGVDRRLAGAAVVSSVPLLILVLLLLAFRGLRLRT